MTRAILPRVARPVLHGCLATLSLLSVTAAMAASNPTDISQTPLVVTNSAQIKPNIMLLMDNSGSMGRTHMPDEVESVAGVKSIGYKSSQCNALYFNPDTPYALPKRYNGVLFAKPTFGAAPYAGYVEFFTAPDSKDVSVPNLNTDFVPYDWGKNTVLGPLGAPTSGPSAGFAAATPGPAYYYVYTDGSGAKPASLAYSSAQCKQLDTGATVAATGGGTWTRYNVALRPTAEQRQFRSLVLVLPNSPEPHQERGQPGLRRAELEQAGRLHHRRAQGQSWRRADRPGPLPSDRRFHDH